VGDEQFDSWQHISMGFCVGLKIPLGCRVSILNFKNCQTFVSLSLQEVDSFMTAGHHCRIVFYHFLFFKDINFQCADVFNIWVIFNSVLNVFIVKL
jgi:hypothetical protein